MDDQVMELLAKIFQAQTEMQGELKGLRTEMHSELKDLRTDQETLAQNVAKIINVLEHDLKKEIGAIFDFREVQIDHNQKTDQTLERIEAKVEALQLETLNLKRIK